MRTAPDEQALARRAVELCVHRRGRPRSIAVTTIWTVLIVSGVLASCHGGAETPSGSTPATNATTAPLLPTDVLALPSFDFNSFEQLLYQLRGTPVIVNLWASWCGPCRQEAPVLTSAAARFGDRVQFLGVDMQDQHGPAVSYLKQYGVSYPSVSDQSGEIHDRLGFVGLPDTVFYAANGQIVESWSGPITAEALSTKIKGLIPTSSV